MNACCNKRGGRMGCRGSVRSCWLGRTRCSFSIPGRGNGGAGPGIRAICFASTLWRAPSRRGRDFLFSSRRSHRERARLQTRCAQVWPPSLGEPPPQLRVRVRVWAEREGARASVPRVLAQELMRARARISALRRGERIWRGPNRQRHPTSSWAVLEPARFRLSRWRRVSASAGIVGKIARPESRLRAEARTKRRGRTNSQRATLSQSALLPGVCAPLAPQVWRALRIAELPLV